MTPQQREAALRLADEMTASPIKPKWEEIEECAALLRALAAEPMNSYEPSMNSYEPVPWGHCCDNSVVASHAKRLAMELECLLLDSASSNWWASGNEALEHYRSDLDRLYPQDHVSPMGSE